LIDSNHAGRNYRKNLIEIGLKIKGNAGHNMI
jgi:hypothetical protein